MYDKIAHLQKTIVKNIAEIEKLNKRNKMLTTKNKSLQSVNESLKTNLEVLKEENQELKKKLQPKTTSKTKKAYKLEKTKDDK